MNANTVAIIDDDYICRMVVKKQIECSEIQAAVAEYQNGQEAFEKIFQTHADEIPDLIFLDIFMPIMDGWEFLDRFSAIASALPKIPQIHILSSSVYESDIERADEHELVTGFITKPVKLRHIQRILHKIQYYGLSA